MKNKIVINCHSSIKIIGEKNIYFDPFKIEEETHDADLIFITHDHYDHYDIPSINKIKKEDTIIIIPDSIAPTVLASFSSSNIVGVSPNELYNIDNFKVETIPSYNINADFHPKKKNYVGYIITLNGERIYVAGDTDLTDENKNIICDIALIPIGGTYTMNYEEAAILTNIIKPSLVIPTHYGKIVGNFKDGENFKRLINENIECKLLIKEI